MESESSSIALEQQIKELIEENLKLQKRVTDLEAIVNGILDPNYNINRLKTHKSAIMHENEFNLIGLNIKSRCNKTVKHLKKIYQASIDGDNMLLLFIQNVIIFLILQFQLKQREIEDLEVLLLLVGLHQIKVNGMQIQMHLYFPLISKKFILLNQIKVLFIIKKILGLGLE